MDYSRRFRIVPSVAAIACGTLVTLLLCNRAWAQVEPAEGVASTQASQPVVVREPVEPAEGAIVDEIRVEGLRLVDRGYARALMELKAGQPYSSEMLRGDINRLLRTAKFEDVNTTTFIENGRLILQYAFIERMQITSIEFVGNERFSDKDLTRETPVSAGSPISEFTIADAIEKLTRKYQERGYYYVAITTDQRALTEDGRLVFQISEGPRVRVREIEFIGGGEFSDRTLQSEIDTKTYIYLLRRGDLDVERVDRDINALTDFLRKEGYLDAEVGYELDFADNREDLKIRFVIELGVKYAIASIRFVGLVKFPVEEIEAQMRLAQGDVFRDDRLQTSLTNIRTLYWAGGYIYAGVRSDWVYSSEPGLVDLAITIEEGEQYRFGRIIVRGNENTQDRVVRRQLDFYPEDLYDKTKTDRAERRLAESRLFSKPTISPIGDDPQYRDALVQVDEADTTQLIFGVGVTSNSGVIGSIMYENRNFDIFDESRTTKEFFSGRSFRGAGQTLRINLEPGTQLNRFRIDFREPYMFDQPYGLNLGAYLFERSFREYRLRTVGFTPSVDHRFADGPLRDWAVELALRVEDVKVSGLDELSDRAFRRVEGSSWLTSMKGTVTRNTTDSLFLPSKGSRFSASWEQFGALGGDYVFARTILDYSKFFTVGLDEYDRKHILAVGGTVGNIYGDAPPFEKFYGGGLGSVRGFDFRGISPRGGKLWRDNEALGGDFLALFNVEYSYPLVGEYLRGVTFLDTGTVEQSVEITKWRAAAGVGARIYVPFFGPIPISLDFAWPLTEDSKDDTRVFSFSIGASF